MDVGFIRHILFWMFVPGLLTRAGLTLLYRIFPSTTPQQGSKQHQTHIKLMYAFVITTYLAYTAVQIEKELKPSYYSILDLSPSTFNERDLKNNYRKLSLMYHPDKIGSEFAEHENLYLSIRKGYEVLKDPLKKTVYDRFGESDCAHCKSFRDYLSEFYISPLTFYVSSFGFLGLLHFLNKFSYATYWRICCLLLIASIEGIMVVSDIDLSWFAPSRPNFQKILLMRELYFVTFVAVSQLGPLIFNRQEFTIKDLVNDLEDSMNVQTRESVASFTSLFAPFNSNPASVLELESKLKSLAVEYQLLQSHPNLNQKYEELALNRDL